MREKLNMPFGQQHLRKEISLAQVIPEWGLRLPPDHASDATSQDTEQRHVQTRSPPQKHAQPVEMGTLEDGLSPGMPWCPPRPGEWNLHRDALAHLRRSPLLPKTPAQLYESRSNDGAWVPAPQPLS